VPRPIDVVVPGRPTVDVVLSGLDAWPRVGREVYAHGLAVAAGAHFNVAAALARLGLDVAFVAIVGDDVLGELVLRSLRTEGVAEEHVEVLPGVPTPLSIALNHTADRGFVTYGPDHEAAEDRFVAATLELLRSRRVRHVHGDLSASRRLVDAAGTAGATFSVDAHDAGPWLASDEVRGLVSSVDVVFVNEAEAIGMTGAAGTDEAARELARSIRHVVVKRGAHGATAYAGGEAIEAAGVAARVVDATGAGDCFAAGYLWGYLDGRPPAVCLGLGNLCGARAVQYLGGYAGAPTRAELVAAARERGLALA
jgi:sugar/nucleoside kinase (ribokinase family)